jgi:hypothetical protein
VIRRETDYYLQPVTGQPVKLNSTQDLSQHVGHHVRAEGSINNGSSAANASGNGSNTTSANGGYGSSSAAAGTAGSTGKVENGNSSAAAGTQYQEMNVTRVDTISESCPSGMQNQSAPSNNNNQSPK